LWGRCVGKHVTSTPTGGKTGTWTMRTPVTASGITATIVDKEAGDGYACAHGITAKSNVVIDVAACGYAIADQGATPMTRVSNLVNAIAGKFPA
jgi:hypothetical protein